jgi:hypothetical protein
MLSQSEIRELDDSEINLVNGGIALGTGPTGIFSATNIATAGRLVTGLGYLGGAFTFGFAVGNWGYSSFSRYRYNSP